MQYRKMFWMVMGILLLGLVMTVRSMYADQTKEDFYSQFDGSYYYQGGFFYPDKKWLPDPKRDQQIVLKFTDGSLKGMFFGSVNMFEETGDADDRYGYFEVFMENLTISPTGEISFSIGPRDYYTGRINDRKRKDFGVNKDVEVYKGKITKDEIQLNCEGCRVDQKNTMKFKKTE